MCLCCEVFPECYDRYWDFGEHPCLLNACCYACCGNGLEDPNFAQRLLCQCNTVANYDECLSETHLISTGLCCLGCIPGAIYATLFWEPHYDAERDKARKAFLQHRAERNQAKKEAAKAKKKAKRKSERERSKRAAKKRAKENFIEFDEEAWAATLPVELKKKPHRTSAVAPEEQSMEFRGLKKGFLVSGSRPATAATAPSRPPTATARPPTAAAPAPAPAPAEEPA